MFRERSKDYKQFMMDEHDFFRGVTASEVQINKKPYTLAAGFMGVEFETHVIDPKYPDELLQWVKPAKGWALYEEDPSREDTGPHVFLAAETAGPMF